MKENRIYFFNRGCFFYRSALIVVCLLIFISVLSYIVTEIYSISNPTLNLILFIAPVMAVYFGLNSDIPELEKRYSGKCPESGPEEYQVLILAFVIPFLTYYIIIPLIPVAIACLADEMMYSSNSEIIFSYLQNHRDKIFQALAIGIAGTGGVLKKRKTVLSVCCLILSPFVMAMNIMHSL